MKEAEDLAEKLVEIITDFIEENEIDSREIDTIIDSAMDKAYYKITKGGNNGKEEHLQGTLFTATERS